MRSSHSVS